MTTDLEARLHHYGESFERAVLDLPSLHGNQPRTPQAATRKRERWFVAAALLAAAAVIAAAVIGVVLALPNPDRNGSRVIAGGSQGNWVDYRDKANGFRVEYPSSWTRSEVVLAPGLTDAKEILSVATYPLRPGSVGCAEGPENAIADLPPTGALITVQERTDRMLFPARSVFPPADEARRRVDQSRWCVSGSEYEHWWLPFDDHDRSFQVLVAFGLEADAETRDAAWRIVNSVQFEDPAASPVPNHVSASLYDIQAMGANAMVFLADGSYETAVRVDDNICIDLRPRGAPSGPQICDIPARAPWPTPVIAGTVELNGTHYLIGVASDQVVSAEVATNPGIPIGFVTHQPFPTLRFFAVLVGNDQQVTLRVSLRSGRVVSVNADAR